jgi:hypothetical protein
MLGRNTYETEELENARSAVKKQLADWRAAGAGGDLETTYFNSLVLVLDRYFVHRVRNVSGKDANPLNEVEMLTESLMNHDGVLQASTVLKYQPEGAVLGLEIGDEIRLSADDYERLSAAFLDELEKRFVS